MTPLECFAAYAAAFEETYRDDDWSRLEAFLAPDVVYRVVGSPGWDCVVEGRPAVFAAMRRFLDGFDRRCTRAVAAGDDAPVVEGDTVRVAGTARYRRGESDELLLELELHARCRDGRLVELRDEYPPGQQERIRGWLERWGGDLDPSYV